MLPHNFAHLASDNASLVGTVRLIEQWCEQNSGLASIDPRRIAVDLDVDARELTNALFLLVNLGVLRQVYKFETPDETFAPRTYNSYSDVPAIVRDRADRKVRRADGKIVPVFQDAR